MPSKMNEKNLFSMLLLLFLASAFCPKASSSSTDSHLSALPSSFVTFGELFSAGEPEESDAEKPQRIRGFERDLLLRIGFDQGKGLAYFYLKAVLLFEDYLTELPSNAQTQNAVGGCSYHPYTSWLLPTKDDAEKGMRPLPPGLVTLCHASANGTLPINSTHMARIEPVQLPPDGVSSISGAAIPYLVRVFRIRSQLVQWQRLEWIEQSQQGSSARPTLKRLHRVRRDLKYRKYDVKRMIQYQRVNITLNLQHRFLTKYGPYVIKIHVYLDTHFRDKHGNNKHSMIHDAKEVVNFANVLLRPFNMYIVVSSLHVPFGDVYTHKIFGYNPLKFIQSDYIMSIWPALHNDMIDCIFVFIGKGHMNYTISESSNRKMCEKTARSFQCYGYILLEPDRENFTRTAGFALAHEVAKRLGVPHDDKANPDCDCPYSKCVMDGTVEPMSEVAAIGWSYCSIKKMITALDTAMWQCIKPVWYGHELFGIVTAVEWGSSCGNGIVEPGEDCDCGGARACRANKCCNPVKCKLLPGAKCAYGTCCDLNSCKLRPSGSLCRPSAEPQCDVPEYCTGKYTSCPVDVTIHSGWPCEVGGAKQTCQGGLCWPSNAKYNGPKCDAGKVPLATGSCVPKPTVKQEEVLYVPQIGVVKEVLVEPESVPDNAGGGGSDIGGAGGGGSVSSGSTGGGAIGSRGSSFRGGARVIKGKVNQIIQATKLGKNFVVNATAAKMPVKVKPAGKETSSATPSESESGGVGCLHPNALVTLAVAIVSPMLTQIICLFSRG